MKKGKWPYAAAAAVITFSVLSGSAAGAEIRPQDDYYGYINAEYLLNSEPVYGENTSGTFDDVTAETAEELYEIIRELADSDGDFAPGSSEQLVRDFYLQAAAYENDGSVMEEIGGLVEEIWSVQDMNELLELWVRLNRTYGAGTPISAKCSQDYFEAGNYALFIDQLRSLCQSSLEEIRDDDDMCINMKKYIRDTLLPFTEDSSKADEAAEGAVYLALEIAQATDYEISHAVNQFAAYEFISEEELADIFTNLDTGVIKLYFGLEENPYVGWYIQDRGQLEKINELLTNEKLEQWKTILVNSLVTANMSFLYTESPSLSAYGESAAESREVQVCDTVILKLYDWMSDLYARKYYTDEADTALGEMCEQMRESYKELIADADWISVEGRKSLQKKLENMTFILGSGVQKEIDPADGELIADTYPETLKKLNENTYDRSAAKIGTDCDLTRASMGSFEVNARYSPSNTVTVTVAIMHAPFFDSDAEPGANLGGLGQVIAHEIGHGFDSLCLAYDENGNYNPEWLSEEDRAAFAGRAQTQSDYFSQYTILDVYHVDGDQTSFENYADLGAMECITNIPENEEALENLFENYARIYAENCVDTYAVEMLETDEHSPSRVRVNAVLSSCEKFYEIYEIGEDDEMYKAPGERVSRW